MKPNTCGETWTSWQTIFQPRNPNHNKLSNELDPMEAGLGVVATEVGDAAGWDGTGQATATSTEGGGTGATSTEGAGSGATSAEGAGTAPTSTAGASTGRTSTTGAGGAASAEWASSDPEPGGAPTSPSFPLSASDSLLEDESQASSSSGLMSSCGEKQKLKTNTYKHKFINQGKRADNIKPRHTPLPKTQCVLPPPLSQSFFRPFVDPSHFLLRRWHTKN